MFHTTVTSGFLSKRKGDVMDLKKTKNENIKLEEKEKE